MTPCKRGMSIPETAAYVKHHMEEAKLTRPVFAESAVMHKKPAESARRPLLTGFCARLGGPNPSANRRELVLLACGAAAGRLNGIRPVGC